MEEICKVSQTYKLRYKTSDREIEVEGDKDFTEKWFEILKELLKPKRIY